jgi:hypothetical protein
MEKLFYLNEEEKNENRRTFPQSWIRLSDYFKKANWQRKRWHFTFTKISELKRKECAEF